MIKFYIIHENTNEIIEKLNKNNQAHFIFGIEETWLNYKSLSYHISRFEFELLYKGTEEIPLNQKNHWGEQSSYRTIHVFVNPQNGRLFKWQTKVPKDLIVDRAYNLRAGFIKEEYDGIVWIDKVRF
jgi:hypothetical protein